MNEIIWKPVPREPYSRFYEVSNTGLVRRIPGFIADGRRIKGGELAKVIVKKYHLVLLQCEGKKWMPRVHQLVALAFIGEPPGAIGVTGWTVNHKNFEKLDNRAENLEWMTAQENHTHAVLNGLKSRGEKHYKAILSAEIVRRIRTERLSGKKILAIADMLGLKEHNVSDVLLKRCWAHIT